MNHNPFRLRDLTGPQLGTAIQAKHIQGLDAFRALAVLFVLLGHGIEGAAAWSPSPIPAAPDATSSFGIAVSTFAPDLKRT